MQRLSAIGRAVVFAVAAVTAACATPGEDDGARTGTVSLAELRDENRDNIDRLKPGMTVAEVTRIMGRIEAYAHDGPVTNPYRRETLTGAGGARIEIHYYYTRRHAKYGKILDRDLTPVVFENGRLTGVGRDAARAAKGWW